MKNLTKIALVCTLASSMTIPNIQAHAQQKSVSALEKQMDSAENVLIDKRWTIQFNKKINVHADLEKFVYVENTLHEKVPVEVSINNARTKVYVEPISNYEIGKTYKLVISDNLTSESGKKLKEQVVKKFTTIGAANKNDLAQNYTAKNEMDEGVYVALGETNHNFIYKIVDENGEVYRQGGARSTENIDEVFVPPHYTLHLSYTSVPTVKPYGEETDIHFTSTDEPAIQPIVLNKGESLTFTRPNKSEIIGGFYISSESDVFLPYIQDRIDGKQETEVTALKANTINEVSIGFERKMTISNVQDQPITIYNLTEYENNIDIEKTFQDIKGFTLLAPGETTAVTMRQDITTAERINLKATALDGKGSLEMVKYAKTDDGTNEAIVESYFDTTNFSWIDLSDEEIYLKNTSSYPIAVYDEQQMVAFEKTTVQPLKQYVIQPGDALNVRTTNDFRTRVIFDTYNKDVHYRELEHSSYEDGHRELSRVIEKNTAESFTSYKSTTTSSYPGKDQTFINLNDTPMTIYMPSQAVMIQDVNVKAPTKMTINPNQIIKVTSNEERESVFISSNEKLGAFKYVEPYMNGDVMLANQYDEQLNNEYEHYWQHLYINDGKYIQNTGTSNIDIYTYDDNVQFTTVPQLPEFPDNQ